MKEIMYLIAGALIVVLGQNSFAVGDQLPLTKEQERNIDAIHGGFNHVAFLAEAQAQTRLPSDIVIEPASEDIPEPLSACLGVWSGRWERSSTSLGGSDSGSPLTLIVHRITRASNGRYFARVTVVDNPKRKPERTVVRNLSADADGTLYMDNPPRGVTMRAHITSNRQEMEVQYSGLPENATLPIRMHGRLWRIHPTVRIKG